LAILEEHCPFTLGPSSNSLAEPITTSLIPKKTESKSAGIEEDIEWPISRSYQSVMPTLISNGKTIAKPKVIT